MIPILTVSLVQETREPEAVAPVSGFFSAWLGEGSGEAGMGEPSPAGREAVAAALDEVARALDGAWPEGVPHRDAFWAELARCVPDEVSDEALPEALRRVHAVELHLAFACRRGHAGALARFEREHVAALGPAVGRVDSSPAFVDEIKQRLRTKLLVADGSGPPKIAHYTGQGSLLTWVRVVAVREALSSVRAERRRALAAEAPASPRLNPSRKAYGLAPLLARASLKACRSKSGDSD